IRREFVVWLRLKHYTIVPLLGIAHVESPFPALISQWMPSGTLCMYLEQGTITISARVELASPGIADGLKYLHSESVVHGDLHPGNVLIDSSGSPRLTDFGLATIVGDEDLQLSKSTAYRNLDSRWRAPEVLGMNDKANPERPTFESDIYSFGGVMFYITSGDKPWKERGQYQICFALATRTEHTRPDNIFDHHWDCIENCWSWDSAIRPPAAKILEDLNRSRTADL
ncbi:kinase-like protein, partial [Suillus brevipes Sb2]